MKFWSMSGDVTWRTPKREAGLVHQFFDGPPDFDPCGSAGDPIGAKLVCDIAKGQNGLKLRWRRLGRAFANPPYSRQIAAWMHKARAEYTPRPLSPRSEMVILPPANTDSRWWHECCETADAYVLVRGRYHFDPPASQSIRLMLNWMYPTKTAADRQRRTDVFWVQAVVVIERARAARRIAQARRGIKRVAVLGRRSTVANAWVYWGTRLERFLEVFGPEGAAKVNAAGWARMAEAVKRGEVTREGVERVLRRCGIVSIVDGRRETP